MAECSQSLGICSLPGKLQSAPSGIELKCLYVCHRNPYTKMAAFFFFFSSLTGCKYKDMRRNLKSDMGRVTSFLSGLVMGTWQVQRVAISV